jgi:hypothetical protein
MKLFRIVIFIYFFLYLALLLLRTSLTVLLHSKSNRVYYEYHFADSTFALELLSTLTYLYTIICINSLYLNIKEENRRMTNRIPLQVITVQHLPSMYSHPSYV